MQGVVRSGRTEFAVCSGQCAGGSVAGAVHAVCSVGVQSFSAHPIMVSRRRAACLAWHVTVQTQPRPPSVGGWPSLVIVGLAITISVFLAKRKIRVIALTAIGAQAS